jgi:hypothetical protein
VDEPELDFDVLIRKTGLTSAQLMTLSMQLEMKRVVRGSRAGAWRCWTKSANGTWRRARPPLEGKDRKNMAKKLVIVESPAKAKTINKLLGGDFIVKASMGHVRDLPERALGVDVEHGFAPQYVPIKGRAKCWRSCRRRRRRWTWSTWRPTRTAKGKPSRGICGRR